MSKKITEENITHILREKPCPACGKNLDAIVRSVPTIGGFSSWIDWECNKCEFEQSHNGGEVSHPCIKCGGEMTLIVNEETKKEPWIRSYDCKKCEESDD